MKIKNKSLQTWAKLLPFLAPYKWQMILIIALMILGACFDMVQPQLILNIQILKVSK